MRSRPFSCVYRVTIVVENAEAIHFTFTRVTSCRLGVTWQYCTCTDCSHLDFCISLTVLIPKPRQVLLCAFLCFTHHFLLTLSVASISVRFQHWSKNHAHSLGVITNGRLQAVQQRPSQLQFHSVGQFLNTGLLPMAGVSPWQQPADVARVALPGGEMDVFNIFRCSRLTKTTFEPA